MTTITFDVTQFREQYPEFANPIDYTDARLQYYFDLATCYISDQVCGRLSEGCRRQALYMMTAHLAKVLDPSDGQNNSYLMQSATEGQISVTVSQFPDRTQWAAWLNTTSYGKSLLSLLSVASFGGYIFGGLPERSAFRKVGGVF